MSWQTQPELPVDTVGAFVTTPETLLVGSRGQPLTGSTLAVKDLFDVVGTITGAGNPRFASGRSPAETNADAVELLVAAGATVIGKTITDELAYSLSGTNVHYGMPVNTAAPGRVPGGSSAGSAAAVAAGIVDLALGTDTGGSIRVPASYCGIYGWRPTHGAVPIAGVVPLSPSFDTVGLFASRIDLLATAATALLAGQNDAPHGADLEPVLLGEALADCTSAVAAEVRRIGVAIGASDEPLELGISLAEAMAAFRTRQGWEAWQAHGSWIREQRTNGGPGFGPGIASRFEVASTVTEADLPTADAIRQRVRDAVVQATAGGRVLVMPGAAGAAPTPVHDPDAHEAQRMRTLRLTCVAGLAGAPVVVLPFGVDHGDGDLPLGIALLAAPGSDLALLRYAVSLAHEFRRRAE